MNQTDTFLLDIFEKVEENVHLILILIATFFIMFLFIAIAECYNAYTLTCKKIRPKERCGCSGQSIHGLDVID